jgi:ribonuclease G
LSLHRAESRAGRSARDQRDQRDQRGIAAVARERHQPAITDLLSEGQEILVQIAKEPIAKKGARITSHIALPGRFLVYMPTWNTSACRARSSLTRTPPLAQVDSNASR